MKRSIKISLILLLLTNNSFGQGIPTQIDSLVNVALKDSPELGISVGVIANQQEYYRAYGTLNKKSQVKINQNSIFEIASITKIITANLIAIAAIEKKLVITDYIDNYLPQAYVLQKNLRNKISIADLASHQSGLPDLNFRKLIELNPQQPIGNINGDTLVRMINDCSQLIDHGNYRYSTMGFVLLGQILEQVHGKSYDEIVREYLLTPLQLTNTITKDMKLPNLTAGYNPSGGEQEFFHWNITAPAGLIKSSAADMILYLKAVLDRESTIGKAAILTEKIRYSKDGRTLGLGVNILSEESNTRYLKSGDSMGQSSIICYNREKSWGVIILLNHRNSKVRESLLNEIYEVVLK